MALLRSLNRSSGSIRSSLYSTFVGNRALNASLCQQQSRTFVSLSPCPQSTPLKRVFSDCRSPFGMASGSIRTFSVDVAHYPDIKDPEIKDVFKDFMAADWGELPNALIYDAKKVLSKSTDDEAGKEALKNVFRAAEAVEEFTGTLESLKLGIDDSIGLSGENAKPASKDLANAVMVAFERYSQYLESFGPDEVYLRKKVETALGTRMIHIKMRCGGLGPFWGKVSLVGTSGIAGSYVEQRKP